MDPKGRLFGLPIMLGSYLTTGTPVYHGEATTALGPQAPLRIVDAQIKLEVATKSDQTVSAPDAK